MGKAVLRFLLMVFGVALVLAGGLWTLQGLGIVMWPAESFMLADLSWAFNGIITVAIGVLLLWFAKRAKS